MEKLASWAFKIEENNDKLRAALSHNPLDDIIEEVIGELQEVIEEMNEEL